MARCFCLAARKLGTAALLLLAACATTGTQTALETAPAREPYPSGNPAAPPDPGQEVLAAGNKLVFADRQMVVGSCWDFVNAVYYAAGYPPDRRQSVFHGRQKGPYANLRLLRPGDWVMHVNYELGRIGHSGIFVRWLDRRRSLALMLDYVGMHRRVMGKLSEHNLSRVFAVLRPRETS